MNITWNSNTVFWGSEEITGDYIFHVDSVSGNDLTGDGSSGNRWASPEKAVSYILSNTTSSEVSVVLMHPGEYNSFVQNPGWSITGICDNMNGSINNSRKIKWVGHKDKTKITVSRSVVTGTHSDTSCISLGNPESEAIGITFDYYPSGSTLNYTRSISRVNRCNVYNCHFILNDTVSVVYDNSNINWHYRNCSFDIKSTIISSYSGIVTMHNVAFTSIVPTHRITYANPGLLVSSFSDLSSSKPFQPVDGAWEGTGTSGTNYGVYGGLYDWDKIISLPIPYKTPLLQTGLSWKQHRAIGEVDLSGFIPLQEAKLDQNNLIVTDSNGLIDLTAEGTLVRKYYNPTTKEVRYVNL